MPPKRASSKKASTKLASSADAEAVINVEKEVVEEIATDAKNMPNGSLSNDDDSVKQSPKLQTTKRSSARSKNVAPDLEAEAPLAKKPVVKGRGKKKLNEVIENENDISQPEIQKVEETKANEEDKTKLKGIRNSGGKNAETKTKNNSKAKGINKDAMSTGSIQEENANQVEVETKVTEKNAKTTTGRKKKQELTTKSEEPIETKPEIEEVIAEEKDSSRNSRNIKKSEEIVAVIEPQKKKGRAAKKEKPAEKDRGEELAANDIETDVKEKKATKRGRAAAKAVTANEETAAINNDTEEVLPKKRSRKAPSIEKEIVKEKPKRGRGKKAEKDEEKIEVENTGLEETQEINATNGQTKPENADEMEEAQISNKKEDNELQPAVTAAPKAAVKARGGRKRAAPSANNKKTVINSAENGEELDDGVDNTELADKADGSKISKTKKSKNDVALLNSTVTKYNKEDFELQPLNDGQTLKEPRYNLKISSWNVAGLRSWIKKNGLTFLEYEQPDIFCMQETKCANDQLPEEVVPIPGYHPYWLCMPGGYAGVAIYSKIMPINVEYGIGNQEFDDCGRIITAEYEKFFLINVYVPNSGRKLVNLEKRMKWEKLFQQFIQNLDARKPVLICGDMNVSHQEIDLANPKTNTRSAGFTKEERDKMSELLALGFIDTFRHFYPERKGAYTYWTYMGNARSRNVGWRLDYFIVSERFIKRVVDNCIRSQCMGSDHCPITLFLKL